MTRKYSVDTLASDIAALGVKQDDVIFISADLLKVRYFNRSTEQTYRDWLEILRTAVGPGGTIVIPAYTPTFSRFRKNPAIIFDINAEPSAGALSKAVHLFGGAERSLHPTNSCFAIGPMAQYILRGHDHDARSYLPYHRVLDLNGKNLMIGTVDKNNGAMAFHLVQENLGHTSTHPSIHLRQTYFRDPETSQVRIFTRSDIGGCTRGVYNLMGRHIIEGAMTLGTIGAGLSACIDIRKSAQIIDDVLKNNPRLVRCDHMDCVSCYGRFVYNGLGALNFWPKKIAKKLLSIQGMKRSPQ